MKALYNRHIQRCLAGLSFLALGLWGQASHPALDSRPFEPPVLIDQAEMRIPMELWHVSHSWEDGSLLIRVGTDGRVEDWIPLDLPHYRLVRALDNFLAEFRFRPALQGGSPVPCDVRISLSFRELGIGVVNQTISDHIESLNAKMGINRNRLEVTPSAQLDSPLEIVDSGESYVPVDEDGNILGGQVVVEFYVDKDGKPRMLRIPDASNPTVELAAYKTLSSFRFSAPRVRGRPTVVKARIPIVLASR